MDIFFKFYILFCTNYILGGQSGFTNDTVIIRPFGKMTNFESSPDECTSYMVMTRDINKCSAVVRLNNIGDGALNVLRYDSNVDGNNQKIDSYETDFGLSSKNYRKNRKPHEQLYVGNKLNIMSYRNNYLSGQKYRPVGFFRKPPKGIKFTFIGLFILFIYLFVYLFIYLSIYVSIYLFICFFLYFFIYLFIYSILFLLLILLFVSKKSIQKYLKKCSMNVKLSHL